MTGGLIKGAAAGVIVSGLGLSAAALLLPVPQMPAELAKTSAAPPAAAPLPAPSEANPVGVLNLPAGSEFARPGTEALPAAPPAAPSLGEPSLAPEPPQVEAGQDSGATSAAITEPPARPETGAEPPEVPAPPAPEPAALATVPKAEAEMPVPPPGEARAPDLPPADAASGIEKNGEITLMPNGAVVPPSPGLPRVFAPGAGTGFAQAAPKASRLPQIGDASKGSAMPPSAQPPKAFGKPAPSLTPVPALAEAGEAAKPEGLALERFAAPFSAKPGKPHFSVLLIDVGTAAGGLDRETIKALGPWVTVVLDPAAADAREAAALYRAAGLEVAMLADPLPPGALAQDVEVALGAWRQAVPEAVALVEPETPVLQGSSLLLAQAEKALAAEGMAYVTQPGGIGARDSSTVSAAIWRVLDGKRDKAPVISRTLSRAAFEADKEGAVVVMLSAWPESVAGLTAWAAEEGARLNLAPLSATLKAAQKP